MHGAQAGVSGEFLGRISSAQLQTDGKLFPAYLMPQVLAPPSPFKTRLPFMCSPGPAQFKIQPNNTAKLDLIRSKTTKENKPKGGQTTPEQAV